MTKWIIHYHGKQTNAEYQIDTEYQDTVYDIINNIGKEFRYLQFDSIEMVED